MPEQVFYRRHTLAAYLASLPSIAQIVPGTITIKGTDYECAWYTQTSQPVPSAPNQSVSHDRRIYCLGKLPACYRRSSHTVFRFPADIRDWYIACYMDTANLHRLKPEQMKYHPFGEMFILSAWQVPDGSAIDRYETRPYTRIAATLMIEGVE